MTDPKHKPAEDDEDVAESTPELEREKLKDLTPQEDDAEGVKGGPTTPRYGGCDYGTW